MATFKPQDLYYISNAIPFMDDQFGAPIEGDWADGVTGLRDVRIEIAMKRTPDSSRRLWSPITATPQ